MAMVLIGRGDQILEVPQSMWESHLDHDPDHAQQRLAFMTPDHHRVRRFVVRELPRRGKALDPGLIAAELGLSKPMTVKILAALERELFFLVRNDQGQVVWAFPVTVESTPHRLTFDSGEQIFAAWAEDALATPFVQGQLLNRDLQVTIDSVCTQTGFPIHLNLDSQLYPIGQISPPNPRVFLPTVDWDNFTAPHILDAYWKHSVFFWSEEHARAHRAQGSWVDGMYLTLDQSRLVIPTAQARLFGFDL